MNPTIGQRDAIIRIFEKGGIDLEGLETLLRCGALEKLVQKYLGSGVQSGDWMLEVDDRMPLGDLIEAGDYRCVTKMIKSLIDGHERLGPRKLRLRPLLLPEEMKPEEASAHISSRGFQSARLPELLHLGMAQPQLEGRIIALGGLTLRDGINWIPMIEGDSDGRELTTWEFLPGIPLPPATYLVYQVVP